MAFAGCPVVGDEMYGMGGSSGDLLEEETRREVSMDVEAKTRARTMEASAREGRPNYVTGTTG